MKKIILLLVWTGFLFHSYGQEVPGSQPQQELTKDDYLEKSKRQKTGAIVLISAGGALVLVGAILTAQEVTNNLGNIFEPEKQTNKNETVATVLVITGLAAMLGSIGLFVSAHKNKGRAMALSFKNEPVLQFQRGLVVSGYVPSLTLKIPF